MRQPSKLIAATIVAAMLVGCGARGSGAPSSEVSSKLPSFGNGASYVGCYTDGATRALPILLASSGSTVESCTAAARASSRAYAGLQYGGECWAGDVLAHAKVSDADCDMPCSASASEVCGGSWRNSVYSTEPSVAAVGAEYFVATTGSDSNPGSQAQPFGTLERAQAAVRALKSGSGLPIHGVAVTLRGGTYRRTGMLTLGSADSGTSDTPVIWRAYPGETVRISGGRQVTGWTAVTSADPNWSRIYASGRLYKASVGLSSYGSPGGPFAELFYDGQPMRLGRWPGGGALAGIAGTNATLTSSVGIPAHGWATAAALAGANHPWAYINTDGYSDELIRIDGVSGDVITLQGPTSALNSQAVWYATNLLEEVANAGDYWIDRVAGVVYLRPPQDVNPDASGGEAVVSELNKPLLWLDSTSSYIEFQEITFEAAQGDLVVVDAGSGHHTFRGCTFRNSAGSGMLLDGAGHTVDRSAFYALGGLGISMKAGSSNVTVSNTEVHHVARYLHNGVAGMAISGSGHSIRHNAVHDLPWSAIVYNAKNSVIELNEFFATLQQGSDSGTIYAGGAQAATEIRYNYFHDVPRPSAPWYYAVVAVYIETDAGLPDSSGFNVHGNVIYKYGDGAPPSAAGNGTGIINKGSSNTFQNNLFVRVDDPYVWSTYGQSSICTGNQAWLTGNALPAGNVNQDPGFIDEAHGNLANRADGTIVIAGASEAIPFGQIGVH